MTSRVKRRTSPQAYISGILDGSLSINLSVPWYLILSCAYYTFDETLVPDTDFDNLCKLMLEKYDQIEHQHKHLVSRESLSAGTGFDVKYPEMVIGATKALLGKA